MATSTVTPEPSAEAGLEPPVAIAASDTVTQRRIAAALTTGGCLVARDPGAARGSQEAGVLVLAADLGDPAGVAAVRQTCQSMPGAGVTVVSPPVRAWELRRALAAGAQAVVFDGELERTLPPAVRAAAAGLVVVPRALRQQAVTPVFSHREREILGLVATGATNREIADRLFLAESTVKSHLSTAFSKLGVRSRAEAATIVLAGDAAIDIG